MRKNLFRRRLRKMQFENLESRRLLAQVVAPTPTSQDVAVNDEFTLTSNYSTLPAEQTRGLSLRLHFNPDLVSADVNKVVRASGASANNAFGVISIEDEDAETSDNDATTTKYIQIAWVSVNKTFPEDVSPLFDATFTATAAGTANFNYTFDTSGETNSTSASVTISEAPPLPEVSVAVNPNSVAEDGAVNLTYTFARTGDTTEALTVNYATGGTATAGTDFTGTAASVTIPAGSSEAIVIVDPQEDSEPEAAGETVQLTVSANTGVYSVSTSAGSATGTITDPVTPAGQIVTPSPETQSVLLNQEFTLTSNYTTMPEEQTRGLSLRLHFNPNLVSADVNEVVRAAGASADNAFGVISIEDETAETSDNDATTTKYIQIAWVSVNKTFPGTVTPLFDATFTAIATGNANFNYTFDTSGDTSSRSASVLITDGPQLPEVGVAVNPDSVAEDGAVNLTYTFTRTGDTSEPLTVNYATGGTATAGTDFTGTAASVTIPAGMTEVSVVVDPQEDSEPEPTGETVQLTISANTGVYDVSDTAGSATGTITDPVTPTGQVVTPSPETQSVLLNEEFTLTSNYTTMPEEQTRGLSLRLHFNPNLVSADVNKVVRAAGASTDNAFGVISIEDETAETSDNDATTTKYIQIAWVSVSKTFPETVSPLFDATFTAIAAGAANFNYTFDTSGDTSSRSAVVNITETPPEVSVAVSPNSVAENGSENLVYTFTRTGDTTNALTVNYTVSGDATPGTDFTGTGSSVTIDATMTTATVTVDPTPDDDNTENDESVILTIDASSNYTVSSTAGSVTGTIVEPGPIVITWLAPDDSPNPSPLPKGPLPSLWADQRSSFRKVQIDLSSPLASAPTASEIVLTNLGVKADTDADTTIPSSDYNVTVSNNNSRLTIEVPQTADSSGINTTLPDGIYQLTIAASATGTGQPLTITGEETETLRFYVLRGDWDGDGAVSNSDSRTLAYWFLVEPQVPSQFVDLRSPVGINNQDFTLFTQAFGSFLTFPSSAAEPEQIDSADINGDGLVTSRDALNIINALGAAGEGEDLPSPLDANNDGTVTAADALFVINRLAADATRVIAGTADNDEDNSVDQLMTEEGFLNSLF